MKVAGEGERQPLGTSLALVMKSPRETKEVTHMMKENLNRKKNYAILISKTYFTQDAKTTVDQEFPINNSFNNEEKVSELIKSDEIKHCVNLNSHALTLGLISSYSLLRIVMRRNNNLRTYSWNWTQTRP